MDFINKAARQDYELEQKLMEIINEGGGNLNPPEATTTVAGIVKKMENIPDLTEAPVMEDFNNLLAALRTAGLM